MSTTPDPADRRPVQLGFTPEQFPEGTHICYLYSDDEERKRFMSRYVHAGIDGRETVSYLADTASDLLESAAAKLGLLPPEPKREQLKLATSMSTYCPDGEFIPDRMLANLRDIYLALPHACDGARLAAEMTWATPPSAGHGKAGRVRRTDQRPAARLSLDHPVPVRHAPLRWRNHLRTSERASHHGRARANHAQSLLARTSDSP